MLFGEKVFLRPIEFEDLSWIRKWRSDAEIAKYIWAGVPFLAPMGKYKEWYEDLQRDSSQKVFLICDQSGDEPIGQIAIHSISSRNRTGKLEILLGETTYWGKGYGTEALVLFLRYCFRILNLRRIILEVFDYNERAIRSYEKVGFVKEGKVRRSVFKDGRYIDEYFMAIFKEDFLAKHNEPIRE